jgi:FtsZ-binding cell division protein ZapB
MIFLGKTISAFENGADVVPGPSDEPRASHDEAAVLASLVGSTELTDAIEILYQRTLEVIIFMRRSIAEKKERDQALSQQVMTLRETAEAQALQVINILRNETGVPGNLRHQWFR